MWFSLNLSILILACWSKYLSLFHSWWIYHAEGYFEGNMTPSEVIIYKKLMKNKWFSMKNNVKFESAYSSMFPWCSLQNKLPPHENILSITMILTLIVKVNCLLIWKAKAQEKICEPKLSGKCCRCRYTNIMILLNKQTARYGIQSLLCLCMLFWDGRQLGAN